MAKSEDLITDKDLGRWGLVAMGAGGLAFMATLAAFVVPAGLTSFLHRGSNDVVSTAQLINEMKNLKASQDEILKQNSELRSIIVRLEMERAVVAQRVGALETAIPMLLEEVPDDALIDRSLITASVAPQTLNYEAEGGSVTVTTRPLFAQVPVATSLAVDRESLLQQEIVPLIDGQTAATPNAAALPEETMEMAAIDSSMENMADMPVEMPTTLPQNDLSAVQPGLISATDFGVALGDKLGPIDSVSTETALVEWQEVLNSAGAFLVGFQPSLSEPDSSGEARIVAGPISDYANAEQVCAYVLQAGVYCIPVQYEFDEKALISGR